MRNLLSRRLIYAILLFCLFEATTSSPITKDPSCVDKLLDSDLVRITMFCDHQTAKALSCAYQRANKLCTPFLKAVAEVGNTPAFIPAVKRCFYRDSVDCYKEVIKYFQGQTQQRHLAQLPALAAQLGAVQVFQHLQKAFRLSPEHPSWNKWMTRAAIRGQWTFVKSLYGEDKIPSSVVLSSEQETIAKMNLYYVRTLFGLLDTAHSIPTSASLSLNLDSLPVSPKLDWIDRNFVTVQKAAFSTVETIWEALTMSDSDEDKRTIIHTLRKRIIEILEDGVYLMDDILPASRIMISFWLNHYKVDNVASPNNVFLRFLLDEGAPIDDTTLITYGTNYLVSATRKSASISESLWRMAMQYTSGSGATALAHALRTRRYLSDRPHPGHFMTNFVTRTDAHIFDSVVLHEVIRYLARFPQDIKMIRYFVDHGLNQRHVHTMYKEVEQVADKETRERYTRTIDSLSEEVHMKQGTWLGRLYRGRRFSKDVLGVFGFT